MSLLTPEEQEIAFELFNDGANQVDEELSHIYYHHQCPDYRLIAQPVASYLMPLWTMDDMSSLSPAEIYSSCAVIPQETLERDLRNFIFNIFVVYRKMPEKCYSYRMWYALGMMEHFRMERCLDIVLEVLRQDLDFYDFYFGYLYEAMLSAITYQLGQNQLDVLMDFMKEPGLLPMSKYRVIEAVAHIVITHPDRREEVMDWFGNLLGYYFDILKDQKNDICSTLLLDHVTACMMDIRGVETLPILQKIYRTYHIKPYGIPSINELKKKMPTEGIIPYALSALISLRKPICKEYQIQVDTKKLPKDKYGFLVFANGKYYGGGFKPCPDANIDDGWMDVCLISNVKRHQIIKLAKKYQEGNHLQYTNLVSMYQAKTVHLDTENELIYANLDGEVKGFKNPTIEIVEKAIRLALPRIS